VRLDTSLTCVPNPPAATPNPPPLATVYSSVMIHQQP